MADQEKSKESNAGRKPERKPGRGWTERLSGQIRYRRFTDIDAGGRPAILFKFELPPGQSDLPPEVYSILQEMKHIDRGVGHARGERHTGLTFNRSKKHGRVWRLNDDVTGRTVADIIDAKLSDLAAKLDAEPDVGR